MDTKFNFPDSNPKINTLAPVPFRSSSVSPPPIEAEKKINSPSINEKLLFSDFAAKAYKGNEHLIRQKINNR